MSLQVCKTLSSMPWSNNSHCQKWHLERMYVKAWVSDFKDSTLYQDVLFHHSGIWADFKIQHSSTLREQMMLIKGFRIRDIIHS